MDDMTTKWKGNFAQLPSPHKDIVHDMDVGHEHVLCHLKDGNVHLH